MKCNKKPNMDKREKEILQILDEIIKEASIREIIDSIVLQVEPEMKQDTEKKLAWKPIPLKIYGEKLPDIILSSWVFIVRAKTATGAERHPNSHQRMVSYNGTGDLQIWYGDEWTSNILVSDLDKGIGKRWISIPPNIWHQAVVSQEKNWIVISFHTVSDVELIEERFESKNTKLIHQRKYLS